MKIKSGAAGESVARSKEESTWRSRNLQRGTVSSAGNTKERIRIFARSKTSKSRSDGPAIVPSGFDEGDRNNGKGGIMVDETRRLRGGKSP
jgi:hypothetical protein